MCRNFGCDGLGHKQFGFKRHVLLKNCPMMNPDLNLKKISGFKIVHSLSWANELLNLSGKHIIL